MSEVKAVIFDAGGVLHASNSVVTDGLVRELALEEVMLGQIWETQIPLLGSGTIDEAEFWRRLKEQYGTRQVNVAENLLGRAFAEALKPHTDVLDLIKELGNRGITLAVLSNTIEPHARALRQAGLYKGFDRLFLSHEIGMRKPAAEVYEHVLTELKVKPEQAVFVDDDPDNVSAAQALGIHGIVYTDPDQLRHEVQALVPDTDIS